MASASDWQKTVKILQLFDECANIARQVPYPVVRIQVVIVVNDNRALYPEILDRSGLELEARHRRHVNRRTGRRAGEYFEEILVARRR